MSNRYFKWKTSDAENSNVRLRLGNDRNVSNNQHNKNDLRIYGF